MDSLGAAPARAAWGRLGRRLVRNRDRSLVLQLIEAAVGDNVSGIDAVNLRDPAGCNSRLDAAHVSDIVLNHIHERCLAILLNGGSWNQRYPLQRIHQQPGVHKLVWKERGVFVGEDGARFDCPGRGVNLVIERQQLPAGNLGLRSAIEGIDGERSLLLQSSLNWTQTIFRYCEDYSYRIQLGN